MSWFGSFQKREPCDPHFQIFREITLLYIPHIPNNFRKFQNDSIFFRIRKLCGSAFSGIFCSFQTPSNSPPEHIVSVDCELTDQGTNIHSFSPVISLTKRVQEVRFLPASK